MKVRATGKYQELNVCDRELSEKYNKDNYIPKENEEFEISEERYKELSGKNKYKAKFVEPVIETAKKNTETEKAVKTGKKTTKKESK